MPSFLDLSLKQKLMTISLLSSSVALVLACVGFFVYDLVGYREAAESKCRLAHLNSKWSRVMRKRPRLAGCCPTRSSSA